MKQIKIILAVLSVMMLILLTGCGSEQKSSQDEQQNSGIAANGQGSSSASSSDSKQQAGKTKITVYFPDKNGEKLIAASKTVDLSSDSKYTAAVKALLQGPASSGEGIAIMPKNTKLLGTSIDNKGIVTVNFDNAFVKNFTGGSTGEIMLIGSITDTLTNFQEVKAVRFCVEGKPLDALSGHLDLTSPVTRMKDIL